MSAMGGKLTLAGIRGVWKAWHVPPGILSDPIAPLRISHIFNYYLAVSLTDPQDAAGDESIYTITAPNDRKRA